MLRRGVGSIAFGGSFSVIHDRVRIKYELLCMLSIIQTDLGQAEILMVVFNGHDFLFHFVKCFHVCVMLQNGIQNFILFIKVGFELFFELIFEHVSLVDVHTVHHQ